MAVPQVMTPREIVSELDRYIVGQHDAKRAVAIALRNRWRRQNVAPELRDEIAPKNILMIRDLAEIAVKMVREEERARVAIQARDAAEERLLDILYPPPTKVRRPVGLAPDAAAEGDSHADTRE